MDTEEQVTQPSGGLLRGASRFLPERLENPDQGKRAVYELGPEYAKTARNRSKALTVLVTTFLALLVGGAFAFARVIEKQYDAREVKIPEFEDMNLMNLIDSGRRYERQLDERRSKQFDLQNRMEDELAKAGNREAEEEIRTKYAAELEESQKQISLLEEKLATYNAQARASEKRAETVIGAERRLNEIKMAKLEEQFKLKLKDVEVQYEDRLSNLKEKYDPMFETPDPGGLLPDDEELKAAAAESPELMTLCERERAFTADEYSKTRKRVELQAELVRQLLALPYKNSVRGVLTQVRALSTGVVQDYERLWTQLAQTVVRKNEQSQDVNLALAHLARQTREHGFVIDPRDPANMTVFVSSAVPVDDGDEGLVFRPDGRIVASIVFAKNDEDGLTARLADSGNSGQVEPFDRLLVKLRVPEDAPGM